ncbi:hypothetical protein NIBR502772_12470 [Pseudarthrobacter sp. NIBRBAC000502772]|uniref:hypothetical protein n=1 Tax=Pseudarthrobacter sp. NIBRBAC000502772 TaxID=2590775 RepID=UPI00113194B4|nr:hypothetical protein [Pseudarthrobacter sp. NIBRBAC000502772]QDG66908.1 hypothetical protein NIBR502772_12470 [Pseudarthrobacter sp. NIBRBAC000502772]
MDLRLVPRVLLLRAASHPRDHWDAARISKHQQHALRELRNAAYAGSAFYRRHHAGLLGAPLDQLPPVTKAELMANFNDALTVRGPTLEHLEHHLRALAQGIEGRQEDILHLPGRNGTVSIHPNVFHHVLDEAASSGWQVIQEADGLRILLAGITPGITAAGARAAVAGALTDAGVAKIPVNSRVVEHLERTPLGKAPFVRVRAASRDRP